MRALNALAIMAAYAGIMCVLWPLGIGEFMMGSVAVMVVWGHAIEGIRRA